MSVTVPDATGGPDVAGCTVHINMPDATGGSPGAAGFVPDATGGSLHLTTVFTSHSISQSLSEPLTLGTSGLGVGAGKGSW